MIKYGTKIRARYLTFAVAPMIMPAMEGMRFIQIKAATKPIMIRQSVCPSVKSLRIFWKLNNSAPAATTYQAEGPRGNSLVHQVSLTFAAARNAAARKIRALVAIQTRDAVRCGKSD